MPELRKSHKKTDIKLELINELRARSMTYDDIRAFLSRVYRQHGKIPKNCKNPAEYTVCKRTVNRAIESIRQSYRNQLDFNKAFGVYKLELHDFPDTISETEIQALDVAIKKMGNNVNARKILGDLKTKLTTRLYRKIQHTEPLKAARKINDIDQKINANHAFVGPQLVVNFDENVKRVLDSAISRQHKVSFKYYKNNTTVCPLGIIYGPNNVYLIAYDCKDPVVSRVPRHYILSEISNISQTGDWFARDDGFSIEDYAKSMFGIYNDGTIYDVEWLIKDKPTIRIAKKYKFHPTQEFINNPEDGSLTVKMKTGGLHAISVFLAQWGGKIIPIAPQELIVEYKKLLKNCLDSIDN